MRKFFAFVVVVALVVTAATAFAKTVTLNMTVARELGQPSNDVPAAAPGGFARTDTLHFGYYTIVGGNYYAVQNDTWTWDHGAPNTFEGWYALDGTLPQGGAVYFKQITASIWNGHGNQVGVPLGNGIGSAWVGAFEDQAGVLCWEGGLGYGNKWCQRLTSPDLQYDGSGDVTLSFNYFNDSELNFDYTKVYAWVPPADPVLLNTPGFTSKIGVQTGATPPLPVYQPYSRTVTESELGGAGSARTVKFYFEFKADGGWSDEDGGYTTAYGPFGVDDVNVQNNIVGGNQNYTFETGLQGWTGSACPGIGSWFSVQPVSRYTILDPCSCSLDGNVIAFHDPSLQHPVGQLVSAFSPPVRKSLQAPYPQYNSILGQLDMYAEMPQANGVFFRPGFSYYPFVCPSTGVTQWSGRKGQDGWYYVGNAPNCFKAAYNGTDNGIPPNPEDVGFVFEVYASCDAFNVHPCSGVTNFTPIVDNVQMRFTGVPNAPVVGYEPGTQFQDNFAQGASLNVMGVGNADITYDIHRDPPTGGQDIPDLLGDSLEVAGSVPTPSTKYLTRLWFRVRREGPGQEHIARYRTWKSKFADFGVNFVGETSPNKGRNFVFGWMDSLEVGTRVAQNKFVSQFHEQDVHHTTPEQGEDNEIIWDNMLTPGTSIQYFVTSNYTCTPSANYLLPDTAGQFYSEFEILPSYRTVGDGRYRFPCVLYVDAFNGGAQFYIENALNVTLNGAQVNAPIPNPTSWDRYDYLDASSNWCAPMFRYAATQGNSGGALDEFLGYKFIFVNTGTYPSGAMRTRDWQGFASWLTSTDCVSGQQPRQGFWASGDNIGEIISTADPYGYPTFLPTYLGATYQCTSNYEPGCPVDEDPARNDTLYCTKLRPNAGCGWTPTIPIEVYGNWCPAHYSFDVLGLNGGCGNKSYQRKSDDYVGPNGFAQVTYDQSATANNYRAVVDGYSLHHEIRPDLQQGIPGECLPDTVRIVQAVLDEFSNAIKWTLGISDPTTLQSLCVDPCLNVTGGTSGTPQADNALVNRLYQNSPNPFNPRTSIRFSLSANGPAKLIIYDVNGRKVRTLVNGVQKAGLHDLVWDGTDDLGHAVASGVYWSQLTAGDYNSNKKMVVLK